MVEICKWFNDADSPVIFMIDDLANVWVDVNKNDEFDLGEDWGYLKEEEKSSYRYLCNEFLEKYKELKVTFFTPVGKRVGVIANPIIKSISLPINSDEESKCFFKSLHGNERLEIAYHGTSHGKVGLKASDFIQEWQTYRNLDEALKTIEEGKEIYKDVMGIYPSGGKYPGYKSNEFSHESIDRTGFIWWCRYWNKGMETGGKATAGDDENPITNYDIKYFGNNKVIDIPSTINGGLLNSYLNKQPINFKEILRRILKKPLIMKKMIQLKFLLKNKLIISIEEHISPARDDGKIQTPNIFTDNKSLNYIFKYLSKKDVWYCTCTELANYCKTRDSVKIEENGKNRFKLIGTEIYSNVTIKVSKKSYSKILLPNGEEVRLNNGIASVQVLEGEYIVM